MSSVHRPSLDELINLAAVQAEDNGDFAFGRVLLAKHGAARVLWSLTRSTHGQWHDGAARKLLRTLGASWETIDAAAAVRDELPAGDEFTEVAVRQE